MPDLIKAVNRWTACATGIWRQITEPKAWLRIFQPRHFSAHASPYTLTGMFPTAEDIAAMRLAGSSVNILLSDTYTLVRTLSLPKAAAKNAAGAIALQLRAQLPGGGANVRWSWKRSGREGDKNIYTVFIVKTSQIESILNILKAASMSVATIAPAMAPDQAVYTATPPSKLGPREWAAITLCTVLILSAGLSLRISAEASYQDDLIAHYTRSIATLEQKLEAARAREGQRADEQLARGLQMHRFNEQSRPLARLSDIAAALPPDVWISELSYEGRDWSLSAFSVGDAPAVTQSLQEMSWVDTVRLNAPVSYDSFNQQNRIDLTLNVRRTGTAP